MSQLKLCVLCPSCSNKLTITIENNQITSVAVADLITTSQSEISALLNMHNIEFG